MSDITLPMKIPAAAVDDLMLVASAAFAELPFTEEIVAAQRRLNIELSVAAINCVARQELERG